MAHFEAYIDEDMVLHLCPKDSFAKMGLKYFGKELVTHGLALIAIDDDCTGYRKAHTPRTEDGEAYYSRPD